MCEGDVTSLVAGSTPATDAKRDEDSRPCKPKLLLASPQHDDLFIDDNSDIDSAERYVLRCASCCDVAISNLQRTTIACVQRQ